MKLQKIIYFFQEKKFLRNQIVYTEGQWQIDGVYFIKRGEFEVSQKVVWQPQIKQNLKYEDVMKITQAESSNPSQSMKLQNNLLYKEKIQSV